MSDVGNLITQAQGKLLQLQRYVQHLQQENQQLTEQKQQLEQQQKHLQTQVQEWQKKYQALRAVNAILGSNEQKTEIKLKINALVKQINECITQLS